jgi:aromatase
MTATPVTSGSSYAEHGTDLPDGTIGVYGLLADVTRWPVLFAPCLHADVLERSPGMDRFRMWAFTGEKVRSWTSRRRLDETAQRIDFTQESSPPPFASVSGHWRIEPGTRNARLVLAHHWTLAEPGPETEKWVTEALDRNSTSEIAAVRRWAEPGVDPSELIFDFSDELAIAAPAERVYDFLYRSDRWPQHLPHVAEVALETTPASDATVGADVQTMKMQTLGPHGTVHTTRSVRLCFPGERIVYKQTAVPAPLLGHAGEWDIVPAPDGVSVVARHTVALDPSATTADARARVRAVLGRNSMLTLEHARKHAESISA